MNTDSDTRSREKASGTFRASTPVKCQELTPIATYRHFDYLVWFLSADSQWLPSPVRSLLQRGMCEWAVWPTAERGNMDERPFLRRLWRAAETGNFKLTKESRDDLLLLFRESLNNLGLPDDPEDTLRSFLAHGYIDRFIEKTRARRSGRH